MVELQPSKLYVAGSSPVSRSIFQSVTSASRPAGFKTGPKLGRSCVTEGPESAVEVEIEASWA
jgi:hypothetical protein